MRSRSSSSKLGKEQSMVDKTAAGDKLKEEPHLSGAYIRSLVKHLSSSKANKSSSAAPQDRNHEQQRDRKEPVQPSASINGDRQVPQQQPKKQVRRRTHTARPYQERLLNMAEARREIVTALKLHRAAMKQAHEQQKHPQRLHQVQASISPDNQSLMDPMAPLMYPLPNYLQNPPFSSINYAPPPPPPGTPLINMISSWPSSSYPAIAPLLENYMICDSSLNLDVPLPNQPLGLNLNLQGFNNINISNSSAVQMPVSPLPTSSSFSFKPAAAAEASAGRVGLHPAMDEKEMEEIRSLGEQHGIEWSDTVNAVTSAWWSKFLKSMEGEGGGHDNYSSDVPPPLLSGGPSSSTKFEQLQLDAFLADDYLLDAALPCLDSGEREGVDGDWFQ